MTAVLEISELAVEIRSRRAVVRPVDGISLDIQAGRTLGLVGESGCGKSTTGLAVLGLLPSGGQVVSGSIKIAGQDIVGLKESEAREVRGRSVGVVFQDPMTALNPTQRIGAQVAEPLLIHGMAKRQNARRRAEEMLARVGLPRPAQQLDRYPHELSGGMRQRVMIATALICEPKLLVADEPTTALDVTTQDQILRLFSELQQDMHMSVLLITHDMGVVAGHTDEVAVMYAGRLAELAPTGPLFADYRHRYTEALLTSIPTLDTRRGERLTTISGLPPNLSTPGTACRFAPRCRHAQSDCFALDPSWRGSGRHHFACHHPAAPAGGTATAVSIGAAS